jgi:hypothetical protein
MKNFLSNENRDNLRWALSFLFATFLYFGLLFLSYKAAAIVSFSISGVALASYITLEISNGNKRNFDITKIKTFCFFSLLSFFLFFLSTWLLSLAIPIFAPSLPSGAIGFAFSLFLPCLSFLIALFRSKKHDHH